MYVIRDALGPAIDSHTSALAFKNTILRYWPRSTVNGVETFGLFLTWVIGIGVLKDNAHRRIYHQLGMSIKTLETSNYNDLEYTYLKVGTYTAPNGTIDTDDIRDYIREYSPLIYPLSKDPFNPDPNATTTLNQDPNKNTANAYWDNNGWIKATLVWKPTKEELINNSITDEQIIAKVRATSPDEVFYDVYEQNRLVALAIMDSSQVVFQNVIRVVNRTVVDKTENMFANNIGRWNGVATTQVRYMSQAQVEIRFRRTTDLGPGVALPQPVINYLNAVDAAVEGLMTSDDIEEGLGIRTSSTRASTLSAYVGKQRAESVAREFTYSFVQQLVLMANWKHPYEDNAMTTVVDPANVNSYYPQKIATALNVAAISELKPKEFQKVFTSLVKFDYAVHEKKGHWYDAVVSIIIVIVAVVVAVWSYGTGYGLIAAAGALSAGALALSGWAMYLAKNGGSAGAISTTMNMANILGIASMVVGITAIYQAWQKAATEEMLKKAVEKAVEEGSAEAMETASVAYAGAVQSGSAVAGSTSSLLQQGIGSAAQIASELDLIDEDVASIINVASGSYNFLASSETTLANWTTESVLTSLEDGVKKFFARPLSEILNQVVNWMNSGFNAYVSWVAPANEGLMDKMAALEASNKEVETTKPEDVENLWQMYTDPYGSIFEVGDYYDRIYPMMIGGKNRLLMTKCYDSGWKN